MTWRLRTCFEMSIPALVLLCFLVAPAIASTVIGSVRLTDTTAAGRRGRGDYSGVVVWLEPSGGIAPAVQSKTLQMAQRRKHFDPPVLALPTGSTVTFPNFDPIFHNVFSNYSGQIFDVGLYPPGTVPKVVFARPGIVRVFCNIHPTMSAVIVVEDTPYMAVTGANGSVRIEGVVPGEYRLHVFDEQATEQTVAALQRNVTIAGDPVTLAPIDISESGFVLVPHKNKYGREYPAVIEDRPMYAPGKSGRH
jgi:plastocyanin